MLKSRCLFPSRAPERCDTAGRQGAGRVTTTGQWRVQERRKRQNLFVSEPSVTLRTITLATFEGRSSDPFRSTRGRADVLILFASMSMQLQGKAGTLQKHFQEHVFQTSLISLAVASK